MLVFLWVGLMMCYFALQLYIQADSVECVSSYVVMSWFLFMGLGFIIGSLFLMVGNNLKEKIWPIFIRVVVKNVFFFPTLIGFAAVFTFVRGTNFEKEICYWINGQNLVVQFVVSAVILFLFIKIGNFLLRNEEQVK